jgi:hypothetical protein
MAEQHIMPRERERERDKENIYIERKYIERENI